MYVQTVTIRTRPDGRQRFLTAMLSHARDSVESDRGCVRFDLLADETDPNTFYLYEVYRDSGALDEHNQRPSHLETVSTVRECVALPSEVAHSSSIFPADDDW